MSLLILLQKVPTEVKYSWGGTAKGIQNPRPSEIEGGKGWERENTAIWTPYETTELTAEQRSVRKAVMSDQD